MLQRDIEFANSRKRSLICAQNYDVQQVGIEIIWWSESLIVNRTKAVVVSYYNPPPMPHNYLFIDQS